MLIHVLERVSVEEVNKLRTIAGSHIGGSMFRALGAGSEVTLWKA